LSFDELDEICSLNWPALCIVDPKQLPKGLGWASRQACNKARTVIGWQANNHKETGLQAPPIPSGEHVARSRRVRVLARR
jgi:hypothetical protein